MNKPSRYEPLFLKILKEKIVVFETPVPARIKKAIIKRKHIADCAGRFSFRTEVKLINGLVPSEESGEEILYLLHIVYNPGELG